MGVILDGAQCLRPLKTYTISFTATGGTATQAFTSRLVRLNSSAACYVDFDGGAGSTATCPRMSADQTEYFQVNLGNTLNALGETGSGTVTVTECG